MNQKTQTPIPINEKEFVFTGTKECGCVVAIMCKGLEDENEELGRWKDLGYLIEEMPLERARSKLKLCNHND